MHTQTQEAEILGNSFGSSRYLDFLQGLGQLVWLSDCPPDLVYLGGLDRSGTDGQCAYFYQDEIMQGGCKVGFVQSISVLFTLYRYSNNMEWSSVDSSFIDGPYPPRPQ